MGSDGGGRSGPCGACKYLRRKCPALCVFAPYFEPEHGTTHFSVVHKVFGAANVAKLLAGVPESRRREAMATICYEAQARVFDPVHGCVSHILALQQQVLELKKELTSVKTRLSALELLARPWQEICHARPSSFLPFDDTDESEASRGGLGGRWEGSFGERTSDQAST